MDESKQDAINQIKTYLKFTKRAMDEGWDYLLQEQYDRLQERLKELTGKSKKKTTKS